MGLFGLFAMAVGLGAMTKDAISDSYYTQKNYEEAKAKGNPYYFGSGSSMYSVKTGKRCKIDYANGRTLLRDFYTNELIEDLTATKNAEKERAMKAKMEDGCVFYRSCKWDTPRRSCEVWVSDVVPGYFKLYEYHNQYTGKREKRFWKGELEISKDGRARVSNGWPPVEYYSDGVLKTEEEENRRINAFRKKIAIQKGSKFYLFENNMYSPRRNKRYYKDVWADELYVYNTIDEYYIKAQPVEEIKEITKPHHKEVETITELVLEEISGEQKWNLDGSEWIP